MLYLSLVSLEALYTETLDTMYLVVPRCNFFFGKSGIQHLQHIENKVCLINIKPYRYLVKLHVTDMRNDIDGCMQPEVLLVAGGDDEEVGFFRQVKQRGRQSIAFQRSEFLCCTDETRAADSRLAEGEGACTAEMGCGWISKDVSVRKRRLNHALTRNTCCQHFTTEQAAPRGRLNVRDGRLAECRIEQCRCGHSSSSPNSGCSP